MKRILSFILLSFLFLSANAQIGRYPFNVSLSADTSTLHPAYKLVFDALDVKPR